MTLAVAAKLERLVRSDRRFVLLMTDSRFTYQADHFDDNGAKIWKLASHVAAVFAGDVEIAEKTLALVQRSILPPITFEMIVDNLNIAVERFYRKDRPTYFVLGAVSPGGDARTYAIDHQLGPTPAEEASKLIAIGHAEAQAAFWTELGRIPEAPLHQIGENPMAEFHLHALPYISTFVRALDGGGESVGFPMQLMLLSEFGEQTLHLNSIEDGVRWSNRLSASPGEVRSAYREPERRRLSPTMRLRIRRSED